MGYVKRWFFLSLCFGSFKKYVTHKIAFFTPPSSFFRHFFSFFFELLPRFIKKWQRFRIYGWLRKSGYIKGGGKKSKITFLTSLHTQFYTDIHVGKMWNFNSLDLVIQLFQMYSFPVTFTEEIWLTRSLGIHWRIIFRNSIRCPALYFE